MATQSTPDRVTQTLSHSWAIAGALLVASVVVGLVAPGVAGNFRGFFATTGTVMVVASLLIFAVGIRRVESVTDRRPLGTSSLLLLAVWIFVGDTILFSGDIVPALWVTLGYINSFVLFALALIGAVQIARARVVPRPWNVAPAAVLAVNVLCWLLLTLASIIDSVWPSTAPSATAVILIILSTFVQVIGLISVGMIAIVLADRASRPGPTA